MTPEPSDPIRPQGAEIRRVDWRRNLAALWVAEFTAIFGFSFAFPFLPVFIHHDLGIQSEQQVAFWSGLAGGASGLALAAISPLWGIAADRYGRRAMLLRAMVGGGVMVALMGLSRNVVDLTVARFFQGLFSGTVAAATALVASETPRDRVGWSLGVLSSAVALGSAAGPLGAGIMAARLGLRTVFVAGGLLLLVAVIPVMLAVRETRRDPARRRVPALAAIRAAPGAMTAIAIIIIVQLLNQTGYSAGQQLVVIRLLKLYPTGTATVTGIAFGAAGIATGLAAITYSKLARRTGYRRLLIAAAGAASITAVIMALAPTVGIVVAALAVFGLLYGVVSPAISTMLGLEAPREVQARIFGFSASATALGFAMGPLLVGTVAAASNAKVGLLVVASLSLLVAVLMALRGREPRR